MSAIYGGGGGNRHSVFYGGSENVVGAYKDYESSAESAAKRDMVRKILTVFENLKFEGLPSFPTSDDPVELSEVADKLKEVVYKKLKRGLKDDDEVRKKLCKAIARELNSVFGRTVVNEDYSVDSVCTQVNEFCLSFARGLHLEYFRVQNDVKISIKNIKLLLEVMEKTSAQVKELIESTKDNQAIGKYRTIANIYNAAQDQLKRQMDVLENLMNIKTPASMPLAFEPGSDMKPLIESIGIKVSDFGKNYSDNILSSLYGMVSIAVIAARVHKALKDVGLSVSDYKSFGSINELKNKLSDAVGTRTENFSSFEESQKVLEKNFKSNVGEDDWGKLLEALEKTGGAIKHLHDEYNEDGSKRYDEEGNLITPFEKQIDAQYNEKAAIIRSFSTQIATKYENLLKALDELVRNFDKITIDDKSNVIRTNLANLVSHEENERIELALIGVFDTINAREAREMFMMSLKNIMRSCDGVSGFEGLHAAVKSLYELIEHFYETARPKFGGAKEDRKKFSDLVPEINRSGLSLKAGINKFVYFYYLAKIRINSAKSADAIEDASNNYVKLMGLAVGTRINDLKSKLTIMSYNIDGKTDKGEAGGFAHFSAANGDAVKTTNAAGLFSNTNDNSHFDSKFTEYTTTPGNGDGDNEKAGACKKEYKKFIEARIKVLENFYAAVQALDLYLKAFTIEINQHPEKVAELKKMINETEMIGSWYNDKTGDKLCSYFNTSIYRVSDANVGTDVVTDKNKYYDDSKDEHYYQQFSGESLSSIFCDRTRSQAGAIANNFDIDTADEVITFGDHIARLSSKKKNIDAAFDNFTGFKNLMNIFAKIGNVESKSVFLSPSQMYKYFTDFMKNNSIDISKVMADAKYLLGIVESAAVGPISAFNAYGCEPMKFENKLFAHCLKAMTGKVFVTVGFYEILHNITPVGMINQTRIILGGGMKNLEAVDAKADVAELYFRLPRLVEFYRNTLIKDYAKANSTGLVGGVDTEKVITMLPDISGTFSGILKAIFKITDSSEEITYSDEQLRTIIDEANKIHDVYHNTTDAVNALIADVNSRFGMVMKKTLKEYYDAQDALREDFKAGTANETNYQLFNDEGSAPSGKAPSDMYVNNDQVINPKLSDELDIKKDNELFGYEQLQKFHENINKQFTSLKAEDLGKSFDLFIQYGARKIAEAKDKEARMSVAFSLIQDNKNYEVDPLKLQMFQETVVVGLNALKHIDDALDNFMKNIYILRLVRARQEQACKNAVVLPANATATDIHNITDDAVANTGVFGVAATDFLPLVFSSAAKNANIIKKLKELSITGDKVKDYFTFGVIGDAGKTRKIIAATAELGIGNAIVISAQDGTADDDVNQVLICSGWASDATAKLRQQEKAAAIHAVTNYDKCMKLYLENIFTFVQGSNGLVTIDINKKDIKFNITGLRNRINNILTGVKEYVSLFRNFMPEKYIDKYVKSVNDVSVFNIEKTLIYDKFDNTKDEDNLTLTYALKLNSQVHKWLLADKPNLSEFWRTIASGVIGAHNVVNVNLLAYKPYPYGHCIGELVYKFNKLTTNTTVAAADFENIEVNSKPFYKALGMMTQSGDQVWPQPGYGRIDFDDRDKKFKVLDVCDPEKDIGSGSLIQSINQLMLRLVNVCSEISPNVKTYSTLVNTVCASSFGNVLKDVNNHSLPDLVQEELRQAQDNKTALSKNREVLKLFDYFEGYLPSDGPVDNTGNNSGVAPLFKDWTANVNTSALANLSTMSMKDANDASLNNNAKRLGKIKPGTSIAKMIAAVLRWHLQQNIGAANADGYKSIIDAYGFVHDSVEIMPAGNTVNGVNDTYDGRVNKDAMDKGIHDLNIFRRMAGLPNYIENPVFNAGSGMSIANAVAGNYQAAMTNAGGGLLGAINSNTLLAVKNEIIAIRALLRSIYDIQDIILSKDTLSYTFTIGPEQTFLTNYAGPQEDQLLLSSLAYILRTVNASVVKNTSVPSNMTLSLTDVPLYVREQMRANLPVFIHLFDLLNKKAEFLLQFTKLAFDDNHYLNYRTATNEFPNVAGIPGDQSCNCKRLQPGMLATDARKYQLHPYMTNLGTSCRSYHHGANDKEYLTKLLNKISEATFTLYDSCNNVLQELGDIGIFGQTHEGFLESYERRYKMKPITPYSLYLTMLTNTSSDGKKLVDVSGTVDFKRNYAIRGLLNGPVSEEILPYNAGLKIENDYFKFLNNVHDLINYHYNALFLNKFNTTFSYTSKRFVVGKKIKANKARDDAGNVVNMPNAADATDVVIDIIEEPNQKLYIEKLIDQFTESESENSRVNEITRNIVDLNVIPFNVNLLMRDIPLTNIYNYSLAFEKFIGMFIGSQNNSNTGKLFVKLMQEPYLDLGKYDVDKNGVADGADAEKAKNANLLVLKDIFIGDDSLGMGRPKFLSDQLFNKVLTQSVYNDRHVELLPSTKIDTELLRLWSNYVKYHKVINNNKNYTMLIEEKALAGTQADGNNINTNNGTIIYIDNNNLKTKSLTNTNGDVKFSDFKLQAAKYPLTGEAYGARLKALITVLQAEIAPALAAVNVAGIGATVLETITYAQLFAGVGGGVDATNSIITHLNLLIATINNGAVDYAVNVQVLFDEVKKYYLTANINVQKSINKLIKDNIIVGGINLGEFGKKVELYYKLIITMLFNFYTTLDAANITRVDWLNDAYDFAAATGAGKLANSGIVTGVDNPNPDLQMYLKIATNYNNAMSSFNDKCKAVVAADGFPIAEIDINTLFNYTNPSKTNITTKNELYKRHTDDGQLSYVKDDKIHYLSFPSKTMALFDKNYEYRFNTTVIRNLFFITNLNRVLRLLFEKTLTHSRNVIKHGLEFTNPSLTEYGQFPMFPNETFDSKQNNNLSRYSRGDKPQDFHDATM